MSEKNPDNLENDFNEIFVNDENCVGAAISMGKIIMSHFLKITVQDFNIVLNYIFLKIVISINKIQPCKRNFGLVL